MPFLELLLFIDPSHKQTGKSNKFFGTKCLRPMRRALFFAVVQKENPAYKKLVWYSVMHILS
jgi:hypothetical protein